MRIENKLKLKSLFLGLRRVYWQFFSKKVNESKQVTSKLSGLIC